MVTAVVTHGGACAGKVGPFPVEVPWWAEVEPVVAQLERDAGRAGHRLAAADGRGLRRGARRPRHLSRGGTRAAGEARPRATSPTTITRSGCPGRARRACGNCSGGHPSTSASPGGPSQRQDLEPVGVVPPADRRRHGLAQGHPRLRRRRAGRDRRVRRRSTPAWCRRSWPARPAACCWPTCPARTAGRRSPQVAADALGRLVAAQARIGRRPPGHPRPPPAGAGGSRPRPARRPGRRRAEPRGTASREKRSSRGGRCWPTAACPTRSCTATSTPATGAAAPARRSCSTSPTPTAGNPVLDGLRAIDFLPADRRRAAADAWIAAWTAAGAPLPSGRGAADRGTTGAPRVRRPATRSSSTTSSPANTCTTTAIRPRRSAQALARASAC